MIEKVAKYHKILSLNIDNDIKSSNHIYEFNKKVLDNIKNCIFSYQQNLGFFNKSKKNFFSNEMVKSLNLINIETSLPRFLIKLEYTLDLNFSKDSFDNNFSSMVAAVKIYTNYLKENMLLIEKDIKSRTYKDKFDNYQKNFLKYNFQYIINENKKFDPLNIDSVDKKNYLKNKLSRQAKFHSKKISDKTDPAIQYDKLKDLLILLDLCIILNEQNTIKIGLEINKIIEMKDYLIELITHARITDSEKNKINSPTLINQFFNNKYNNSFSNLYCKIITAKVLDYMLEACLKDKIIFLFDQYEFNKIRNTTNGACHGYVLLLLEFYALKYDKVNYSYKEIGDYFNNIENYQNGLCQKLDLLMNIQIKTSTNWNDDSSEKLINAFEKNISNLSYIYENIKYIGFSARKILNFYTNYVKSKTDVRLMIIIQGILEGLNDNQEKIFKSIFPSKAIYIKDLLGNEKNGFELL